jgi:hypothetical protein
MVSVPFLSQAFPIPVTSIPASITNAVGPRQVCSGYSWSVPHLFGGEYIEMSVILSHLLSLV